MYVSSKAHIPLHNSFPLFKYNVSCTFPGALFKSAHYIVSLMYCSDVVLASKQYQ